MLLAAGGGDVGTAAVAQRVTIAVNPTTDGGPFFIAAERGYFARFGIEPVLIRSVGDAAIITALNAGAVDLVQGTPRPVTFELVNRGGRIRAVAVGSEVPTNCSTGALIVSTRFAAAHPRTRMADLRGARIGSVSPSEGIIADYLLDKALEGTGVSVRDIDLVRVPLPVMPDALVAGTVDAVLPFEPFVTLILERGVGVMVARSQQYYARMPITLLFVGPRLRSQPGLTARILAAYLLGVREFMEPDARRNPQTMGILARAIGTSEQLLRKTCWVRVPRDGRINVKMLEKLRDWLFTSGYISNATPMGLFIDEQYLREAWRLISASREPIR